jgi:hypothetical protein
VEATMPFLGLPVTGLWIAFAVQWIVTPATLGHVQHWISVLPLVLEIIIWIIFLPWVGALWIWHSHLTLGLKIFVIVIIAAVTIGMFNQRRERRAKLRSEKR